MMKLYLVNAENIYLPQIKPYFREIISSYDNGNYRSAIVMLYSTIVCDLLLKLKELSDVYSDLKAEKILEYVDGQRKAINKSAWEWDFIKKVYEETELLNDESYTMIQHIYDLRNFSAHPALTDDYELVSPTPEMTVAYIRKALDDIFVKPSVFAQNIVDRMSDDIATKKEIYYKDFDAFNNYLYKVYFQRMSDKMITQVFRAFWKFCFMKSEGEIFAVNRYINRKVLEAMLQKYDEIVGGYVEENKVYFTVAQDSECLRHVCILLAYFPQIYTKLESDVKFQIKSFDYTNIEIYKWFITGDLEQHVLACEYKGDTIGKPSILERVCQIQGQPQLFIKFLIKHYAKSTSYSEARNRFDGMIALYLDNFNETDFIELIDTINKNDQIYNYVGQRERNDKILELAKSKLPRDFDLSQYEHFEYTPPEETEDGDATVLTESSEQAAKENELELE